MSLILTPFSLLLGLLNDLFASYGIAIMVFAIIVKIILFPFSIKGKKGMIQMNMISGEMTKIKQKYGKDPERYNKEVQELYIRENVNPLSGCLWTFLPLFVLIPLYAIIREPIEHLMGLSEQQILLLAYELNWDTVAVQLGMTTQDVLDKVISKLSPDAIQTGFTNAGFNQLYLASLIPETGIILSDGTVVSFMNLEMFGMDLSRIPNWKIWQDFSIQNLAGLLLVAISAGTGIISTKIAQSTNKLVSNQPRNEQMEQTNRVMMLTMPFMSISIGLFMPSIMMIYWIMGSVLTVVQELVAGQILKKDYEAARIKSEKLAAEAKEEEKNAKAKKVEEIERKRAELAGKKGKNQGKKKKKEVSLEKNIDKDASREGLRTHARGRNYDPHRYPNPYEKEENGDGTLILPAPEFTSADPKVFQQSKIEEINMTEGSNSGETLNPAQNKGEIEENSQQQFQELESGREISASQDEISQWEEQKRKLTEKNDNDE